VAAYKTRRVASAITGPPCRFYFFFERELLFFELFFRDLPRAGTLAPASRASDRPIAIACLRLVTRRGSELTWDD
jgi:hypothetical protein